jgi:hypothetical protein
MEAVMAASEPDTIPIPDGAEPPRRRRVGRGARIALILAAIVVGVLALFVAADVVIRNIAEQRVADEIEAGLPAGVEADVAVKIGGGSVIAQYLGGTMDEITVSAPEVTVQGSPVGVELVATDVPIEQGAAIGRVEATVTASEATVNDLIALQDIPGGVTLGDGVVGYDGSVRVLGIPVDYTVTAVVEAAGDTVLLRAQGVDVSALGGRFDASDLVDQLLDGTPVPVCVAEHLPAGAEVNDITVTPGAVSVRVEASDVVFDDASLETTGSCG